MVCYNVIFKSLVYQQNDVDVIAHELFLLSGYEKQISANHRQAIVMNTKKTKLFKYDKHCTPSSEFFSRSFKSELKGQRAVGTTDIAVGLAYHWRVSQRAVIISYTVMKIFGLT
jgi:hypothetical protein